MMYVDPDTWPRVELDGTVWAVAPRYIHGVSMADAETHARHHGCELPTRELVDAIWLAADCQLPPRPRPPDASMVTEAAIKAQLAVVRAQVLDWITATGLHPRIVAGTHKDVIVRPDGRLAIYGWHRLDGRPIQPVTSVHAPSYRDYSQGARLVRRLAAAPLAA